MRLRIVNETECVKSTQKFIQLVGDVMWMRDEMTACVCVVSVCGLWIVCTIWIQPNRFDGLFEIKWLIYFEIYHVRDLFISLVRFGRWFFSLLVDRRYFNVGVCVCVCVCVYVCFEDAYANKTVFGNKSLVIPFIKLSSVADPSRLESSQGEQNAYLQTRCSCNWYFWLSKNE